jgi:hypothetical protein
MFRSRPVAARRDPAPGSAITFTTNGSGNLVNLNWLPFVQ